MLDHTRELRMVLACITKDGARLAADTDLVLDEIDDCTHCLRQMATRLACMVAVEYEHANGGSMEDAAAMVADWIARDLDHLAAEGAQ
ncbi:hypothetical protein [Mycolicibacterium hippocampi]|uniref:Uncharacterized protein n=1 Tax=Mycolicibacterium hippocampi TaxID=659824 RepID=A0A7I9ZRN1_9MYCO|nr:hypothetical protein [Mycolicibacterium hippocampi]GFH03387.1 hypothetical protein MHIP_38700 [Mycolicibacterium hippocampi]